MVRLAVRLRGLDWLCDVAEIGLLVLGYLVLISCSEKLCQYEHWYCYTYYLGASRPTLYCRSYTHTHHSHHCKWSLFCHCRLDLMYVPYIIVRLWRQLFNTWLTVPWASHAEVSVWFTVVENLHQWARFCWRLARENWAFLFSTNNSLKFCEH